jgi:hypothetical protein
MCGHSLEKKSPQNKKEKKKKSHEQKLRLNRKNLKIKINLFIHVGSCYIIMFRLIR